jgi:RNA polymerase sigma factor (sigma-70 family)
MAIEWRKGDRRSLHVVRGHDDPRVKQKQRGGDVVSESVKGAAGGRERRQEAIALTPRERQVLKLLAEGNSNKEIANTFAISQRTVETHRARLMKKLELHSMNQLVRFAIRQRIIRP